MKDMGDSEDEDEQQNIKAFSNKFRTLKANNTKVNSLVRIGKTKWLAFDWDKNRYFTWDSKRQSIALFK